MAYAYGMRFDDDSNAITRIDEENQTAVTTGYINGDYVEFSGNPNRVETITATAENPCVGISAVSLRRALLDNNASAKITLTNENLGVYVEMPIITQGYTLVASKINSDGMSGFDASWYADHDEATAKKLAMINNGQVTDGTAYASMLTSELVITWHPLPEE